MPLIQRKHLGVYQEAPEKILSKRYPRRLINLCKNYKLDWQREQCKRWLKITTVPYRNKKDNTIRNTRQLRTIQTPLYTSIKIKSIWYRIPYGKSYIKLRGHKYYKSNRTINADGGENAVIITTHWPKWNV